MYLFSYRLIDRYILSSFTWIVVAGFVSFAGLYVLIDGANNFDELLNHAKTQPGNIWRARLLVLAEYYGPRLLDIFDQTAGLLAMMAAMLTITIMQHSQELTALMAAGVSKIRVAAPLMLGAIVVSALGVANRELLLPQVRDQLAYNAQDLSGKRGHALAPRYDNHTLLMFSGAQSFPKQRRIESVQVRLTQQFSAWGKKIQAQEAFQLPADEHHPAGYLCKGVTLPADLITLASMSFEEEPVLLSPADNAWLQANECFVVSQLSFQQLTGDTSFRRYLSTAELISGLHNKSLDYGADVKATIHARFLAPLLDCTLFMLGLPLVLGRKQRSIVLAGVIGGGVVAAYFAITLCCHAAAANYLLRPALAAWVPLAIFAPVAYSLARPLSD
jgi:lipopolysaccharide export system permease protein